MKKKVSKRFNPKRNIQKPDTQRLQSPGLREIQSEQHTPSSKRSQILAKILSWLKKPTSWVAIFASIFSIAQVFLKYYPDLNIQVAAITDKNDGLTTQFSYTNTGLLTVHDVRFGCIITPSQDYIGKPFKLRTENNTPGQESIELLPRNRTVTRNCLVSTISGPIVITNLRNAPYIVEVYAKFKLPFISRDFTRSTIYSVRKNVQDGSITLVPDYGLPSKLSSN